MNYYPHSTDLQQALDKVKLPPPDSRWRSRAYEARYHHSVAHFRIELTRFMMMSTPAPGKRFGTLQAPD